MECKSCLKEITGVVCNTKDDDCLCSYCYLVNSEQKELEVENGFDQLHL